MKLLKLADRRGSTFLRTVKCRSFTESCLLLKDKLPDGGTDDEPSDLKSAVKESCATTTRSRSTGHEAVNHSFPSDQRDDERAYRAWRKDQARHSFRPKVDPRKTSILLFPGQGSQFVGMGASLLKYPNVSNMYKIASDVLGYNLLDVSTKGPIEKLNKTVYCQPAIFVASLAGIEKIREEHAQVGSI